MGVNRVDFAGKTLVDLTTDTVNERVLLKGYTAHGADGELVNGAVTAVPTTTSLAATEEGVSALDGTVGKILNDKGSQISLYQADDGVWHFRDWAGADTVIPFKKERKTIDLGKFDGRNSNSIDIKSYIENYQDINSDNFYAKNIGLYWVSGDLGNNHLTFLYDNLTGILNISKFSGQAPNNISFFAYYNIFLVI